MKIISINVGCIVTGTVLVLISPKRADTVVYFIALFFFDSHVIIDRGMCVSRK
ncbi:MAG TPA: hypothetical protein O0W91_04775 [Methanocorpusculum sp.]|nr:hypothetical protein [Methanocorpusculum sp.]HJK02546.1 hypothetical protein [Methanocorpusculum sp.]